MDSVSFLQHFFKLKIKYRYKCAFSTLIFNIQFLLFYDVFQQHGRRIRHLGGPRRVGGEGEGARHQRGKVPPVPQGPAHLGGQAADPGRPAQGEQAHTSRKL